MQIAVRQDAAQRAHAQANVQYTDEKGNPISKERAEEWLEQKYRAHRVLAKAQASAGYADTGSSGSRRVSGNLGCQYYANYGDDVELRAGTARGKTIAGYVSTMKEHCSEGVTLVAPDGASMKLRP